MTPSMLRIDDLPKPLRWPAVVILAVILIASAGAGAYAGGVAKAETIAQSVSAKRDDLIQKDLDGHKDLDDRRFADIKHALDRIEDKLDRLTERGR